jgi:hypothetical protein
MRSRLIHNARASLPIHQLSAAQVFLGEFHVQGCVLRTDAETCAYPRSKPRLMCSIRSRMLLAAEAAAAEQADKKNSLLNDPWHAPTSRLGLSAQDGPSAVPAHLKRVSRQDRHQHALRYREDRFTSGDGLSLGSRTLVAQEKLERTEQLELLLVMAVSPNLPPLCRPHTPGYFRCSVAPSHASGSEPRGRPRTAHRDRRAFDAEQRGDPAAPSCARAFRLVPEPAG